MSLSARSGRGFPGVFMSLRLLSVVALVAGFLCLTASHPLHAARKSKRKAPAQQEQPVTPVPAPPPVELTPAQKPAVPPEVSYHNNELTIIAENSTLGDILRAVHVQTGATIDVPANATERVASRLGPGPARDVLASLLHGSHFDYVIMGTAADPSRVARVVLMSRTEGLAESPASQPNQPAGQPMASGPAEGEQGNDISEQAETDTGTEQQEETQPADQQPPQPNAQPGGVKTPEQLLQELQMQQQQQQNQPQSPPNPPEER